MTYDTEWVNHPKHYNKHPSGIECIDLVEEFNFNVGNCIKYLWRAGLKKNVDSSEDIRKAKFYINREFERNVNLTTNNKVPHSYDYLNATSAYRMKKSISDVEKMCRKVISTSPEDSILAKFLSCLLNDVDPRELFGENTK